MGLTGQFTVKTARQSGLQGDWIALEDDRGYIVRCGDAVLHSVHSGKPRVFRSLDTLTKALREEIGITEFKVVALTA